MRTYTCRPTGHARAWLAALALQAGSAVAAAPDIALLPATPGAEAERSTPFIASPANLAASGYAEAEYLVSGKANVYRYVNESGGDPAVAVLDADVPYVTRVLVRFPTDRARFNGTVLVEVLNATAGWDGDPIWYGASESLMRAGFAWAGVTTKPLTVNFLRDSWGKPPRPARNAQRYQSLSMPAFGQVWDMMTQVGQALKSPSATGHMLNGYPVERLLMVGFSQSAGYETTYANSFHAAARTAGGKPVYDGYFIAGGGSRAKHVTAATPATESLPAGDARNLIRVAAPAVRLQTQTEVVNFGAYLVRQQDADFPLLRTYEVAGGSHVDVQRDRESGRALVRDLGLPPSFCPKPAAAYNPVHTGLYEAAAIVGLDRWVRDGKAPPASRFMKVETDGGTARLARDADGNVLGGVRPPDLEAPLGSYLESNSGEGFCALYGGFKPFDAERLRALYPRSGAYLKRYTAAANAAVRDGFLLKEDARALVEAARQARAYVAAQ